MKERLCRMSKAGYLWKKQRVADEIGVTTWGLDAIIKRLGIKPFWKMWNGREATTEDVIVKIRLSKQEKEEYVRLAEVLGTADLTEYLKWCVRNMASKGIMR